MLGLALTLTDLGSRGGNLKLLGARVDLRRADSEGLGDLEDAGEVGVALSALHASVVGAIDPTLHSECLLRYALFFA